MSFSTDGINLMLDTLAPAFISAHTGDPADSGVNEVSGGSYARQSITWNAAAAKNLNSSNVPSIPIPAATTVTHLGFWDALSGGTYLGSADITDETFASAGTIVVVDADLSIS